MTCPNVVVKLSNSCPDLSDLLGKPSTQGRVDVPLDLLLNDLTKLAGIQRLKSVKLCGATAMPVFELVPPVLPRLDRRSRQVVLLTLRSG